MPAATEHLVSHRRHSRRGGAHRVHRHENAAGARRVSRRLRLWNGQGDLAEGGEPAAHRRLQDSRRREQDSAAHARGDRPRRHHLFERQPCPGRSLRSARGGRQGGHRHAVECTGHQARRDAGAGRRGRGRGRGLERAAGQGRRTGARARLLHDSALRRRADHCRAGNLRARDCRRASRCGPGGLARLGRRPAQRRCRGGQAAKSEGQSLWRRAGAGRRHGGKLSHGRDRHLAGAK